MLFVLRVLMVYLLAQQVVLAVLLILITRTREVRRLQHVLAALLDIHPKLDPAL